MTILWTAAEIADATGGTASSDFSVSSIAFDSREVEVGSLFIAMRGEETDGHRFLDKAFAAGAAGAICEQPIDQPHVLVADSFKALQALGVAARERSHARICGVTGSVGKTGTKEALAAALERHRPGRVHRSVKSYNNHTGVPLSLARMPRNVDFAVFEMGMNHAGEIAALTAMVRPHVALITTIAPAHIEHLGSIEAIADAKGEIFAGLEPGGIAIIPGDSPQVERLAAAATGHAEWIVRFGTTDGADVRALDWIVDADTGGSIVTAQLRNDKPLPFRGGVGVGSVPTEQGQSRDPTPNPAIAGGPSGGRSSSIAPEGEGSWSSMCFTLAQPGDHWVGNAMGVLAAVQALGADLPAAGVALAELPGLAGRGARHHLPVDGGDVLLIDESYNANPASMVATLAQLGRESAGRRIAVLGAMKELGEHGPALHAGLLASLEQAHVAEALLVGDEMAPLADALAALPLERRIDFAHGLTVETALDRLRTTLRPGDAILVKGSNSVGLSRIVAALAGGE